MGGTLAERAARRHARIGRLGYSGEVSTRGRSARTVRRPTADEAVFATRKRAAPVPFAFVLEELARLSPYTRPMFGCISVYVEEKIVLILRDRSSSPKDNGVWVATTREHHASLREELPSLRSITVLGVGETGWQIVPKDAPGFEDDVLRACELIVRGDPRIGKVPKRRRRRT